MIIDTMFKYLTIIFISGMLLSLCGNFIEKKTANYFSKPHVITEEIESEYHAYIRQNKDIAPIKRAINVYTHNKIKSKLYAEMIVVSAKQHNLDPWLVFAVIAKESSFNPLSKSYVGALGLMQIMPFWKDEIGDKNDNLFLPQVSISYGTKILRQYINQCGSIDKALAAYNGSKGSMKYPDAVKKRLKQGRIFVLS